MKIDRLGHHGQYWWLRNGAIVKVTFLEKVKNRRIFKFRDEETLKTVSIKESEFGYLYELGNIEQMVLDIQAAWAWVKKLVDNREDFTNVIVCDPTLNKFIWGYYVPPA